METDLEGKVALVTGASGGIGSAIARRLAAEGACLILHYRHGQQKAQRLQQELGNAETMVLGADLTREADARRLFATALKRFGRIDSLVANAASWESRDVPLHRMSLQQWRRTLDGVLTSSFLCLREFMKIVARQRRGNAVLIASTAAVFGEAGHADYSAGKAGVAYGLTRSLKNEFNRIAPHTKKYCGGRINCICPGWTIVPRLAGKLANPGMIRKTLATMALPQLARPDDIGNAVVYLASDSLARHITGQVLVVAGGMEGRRLWAPEEIDPTMA